MTHKGRFKTILIFAVAVAVLFAAFSVTGKSIIKLVYPMKYTEYVEKYSAEYGIESELLYAVIKTESSFNPAAVSDASAVGLTQITPETFDWLKSKLGESDKSLSLEDPETSIKYGAFFLGYLTDEFKDTDTALAAYHAGRGRVNGWLNDKSLSQDGKTLNNIPIPETAHYVNKVNRALKIYRNLSDDKL